MRRRDMFKLPAVAIVPRLKSASAFATVGGVMYAPCGLPAMLGPVQMGPMCRCGHGISYHRGGRCSWGDWLKSSPTPKYVHPDWDCSCVAFADDGGAYQARLNSMWEKRNDAT